MSRSVVPAADRFYSRGWTVTSSGCWEWNGKPTAQGYGTIWSNGKNVRIHRFAYELWVEEIPTGMMILHGCDNPICINPKHLMPGTAKDNSEDRDTRGRHRLLRGDDRKNTVFSDQQVKELRARYSNGEKPIALIKEYGVSRAHFFRLVNNERRRFIA